MQVYFRQVFLSLLPGLLCLISAGNLFSQEILPDNPENRHYSTEADSGFGPCIHKVKVLMFQKEIDFNLILPSWFPVAGHDSITVVEGYVHPFDTVLVNRGPHISSEDMPIYHHTHDFGFNMAPDSAYRHVLPIKVSKSAEGKSVYDFANTIHIEWETGLASSNKGNICAELNRQGKSCGFSTAGHERRDIIWNYPTSGDWTHVEGLWMWDRGHPPAKTEIHPMRLMAVRRNLPDKIIPADIDKSKNDMAAKFATRVDIFASGDGSAFYNNRENQPDFVRRVKMSEKDYSFKVLQTLPKPSAQAQLQYVVLQRKGNTFQAPFTVNIPDPAKPEAFIEIPWKTAKAADTLVFANTVYLYWDEGNGVDKDYVINKIKVDLQSLKFNKLPDKTGKVNFRVFLEVGGNYIFFNEFSETADILKKGYGATRKRNWKLDRSFEIYVPADRFFRVYARGWDADGIDDKFGQIIDQNMPCSDSASKKIMKAMMNLSVGLGGCHDDPLGEAIRVFRPSEIQNKSQFTLKSNGTYFKDFCPFDSYSPVDLFDFTFEISKIQE